MLSSAIKQFGVSALMTGGVGHVRTAEPHSSGNASSGEDRHQSIVPTMQSLPSLGHFRTAEMIIDENHYSSEDASSGEDRHQSIVPTMQSLPSVIGFTYSALQRRDFDDTSSPAFFNRSWMAGIPDSWLLSKVTMPGTHNTMALYFGPFAKCQSWNLTSQLHAGVRFLDIRVCYFWGNLPIFHGVTYQFTHFGRVLEDVADFLRHYPSETVLMRLKEERSNTKDIHGAVMEYIHHHAHLLWHSRRMPTIGEVRGKIIVLQDFPGPDLGMRYASLNIADEWMVPTLLHVEEKWQSVHEHLEAAQVGNRTQIFLTYTSGFGLLAFPNAIARRINASLYTYLSAKVGQNQRFGIITMDFPAAPLVQLIIDFNSEGCPAQPYIPIYLIVLGVSSLFGLFLTYTQDSGEEGSVHVLISASISVVQVFTLCWFISGGDQPAQGVCLANEAHLTPLTLWSI
ncbi:1-phosphatidylinositol phosphodiesterase-like [Diretmus argenteus]